MIFRPCIQSGWVWRKMFCQTHWKLQKMINGTTCLKKEKIGSMNQGMRSADLPSLIFPPKIFGPCLWNRPLKKWELGWNSMILCWTGILITIIKKSGSVLRQARGLKLFTGKQVGKNAALMPTGRSFLKWLQMIGKFILPQQNPKLHRGRPKQETLLYFCGSLCSLYTRYTTSLPNPKRSPSPCIRSRMRTPWARAWDWHIF